jgi:Sec-independent protein translocase protein TatA
MKNLPLFLITVILCLSLVSALNITPEYSSNILVRDIESPITLTLNITNASRGTYNLYTLADISIEPSETFSITTGPTIKEFKITAKENLDVEGYYSFTYTLNHRDVEKIDEKLTVKLADLEDVIEISSDSIDPSTGQVSFYIKNLEPITLKNLSATFSSILFETEKTFDIGPNEKLEISVNADEDKLRRTKAGVYIIKSVFQTKNGEKEIDGNLYLGEKKGVTSTEDKSGLLIKTETKTKVNVGNVVESIQVKLKRNIFSRLFTTFNIEPTMTERKFLSVEYTWIKERLNPAEAYVIKAKTNYIFPFLILLVIIIVFLGFKRFSETKLEVKKSVKHVKTKNGEFALKVTLAIKAKTDVENVSLIDKVPAIVKIYKKFGMIKPDKIDAQNRRIHWNIGDLNAGEERTFTYIIYSKVGVVGKFSLPEAVAVFEKEGKIHEIDSNKVFFMSDQVRD